MTASLTLPMVMGMRSAVRESALLEGALAKFDVVFGDMADETRAWVDEFREGVPLSRREIVQSAAAMQDLLVPMGVAREEATGMTKDWMDLAAALSAFNDVPVDRALEAIRSGIAGQSRPLREFGIDVRETALQQRALEMGLIAAGEQMDDQVRQQALLAQAYANSKDAVDGYEDQLGTTLMVQQELGATWKDTLATIGQDLQPMYTSLMGSVTDLLRSFNELDDSQRQNIIRMGLFVTAAGPMIVILGQALIWTRRLTVAMRGLNAAMLLNPWVAAAATITAVTTAVVRSNRSLSKQRDLIEEVLDMDVSGTAEEFDRVSEAIRANRHEIDQLQKGVGVYANMTEAQHTRRLRELREEQEELIGVRQEIRKNIDALGLIDRIPEIGTGALLQIKDDFAEVGDEADKTGERVAKIFVEPERMADDYTAKINNLKKELDELKGISLDVITSEQSERVRELAHEIQGLRELSSGIVMDDDLDLNFNEVELSAMATMDSIKGVREAHAQAQQAMTEATTQEERERLNEVVQGYERRLEEMRDFEENFSASTLFMEDLATRFTDSFGRGMANVVVQGEKVVDILQNIGKLLVSSAIQTGLRMLMMGATGGITGSGVTGGILGALGFGGGKAMGGNVDTNRVFMVGERGPEMFVPSSQGKIIPNHQLQGGGSQDIRISVSGKLTGSGSVLEAIIDNAIEKRVRTGRI